LTVHLDVEDGPEAVRLAEDLSSYLSRMSGGDVTVTRGAPAGGGPPVLWVSTTQQARDLAGHVGGAGYALKATTHEGRTAYVLAADNIHALAHGVYGTLELFGTRFFHPLQEFVPAPGPLFLPRQLDLHRAPAVALRGQHEHLLHPIEYNLSLNGTGPQALQEAKKLVDWVVKSGSNHLQWTLLETVDLATWTPHANAIIDYAHGRGVTVAADIQIWGGSSLQRAYVLLRSRDNWEQQMEDALNAVMAAQFDDWDLSTGEFTAVGPDEIIAWFNHAVNLIKSRNPGARVSTHNHVGNFPQLWMQYQGQDVHYYHLSQFADPRLENLVHTVYFFDLYRDWATYNHPNFFHQREFLLNRLGQQETLYFPESAYWIASDVDVPLFLPEYIHSRWLDIHNLTADIRQRGLPQLKGHVLFSSGKEWNYWLTDYLVGRMLWEPDAGLPHFIQHYTDIFGSCAPAAQQAFMEYVTLQGSVLFDQRLVGYLAGEDAVVDVGRVADHVTRPIRLPYEEVYAMTPEQRAGFVGTVLEPLERFNADSRRLLGTFQDLCSRSDAALRPWCAELVDALEITVLRGEHSALLYRAITDTATGAQNSDRLLADATSRRDAAAEVMARREAAYRFDVERLTGVYENPTNYGFGYLRQAHLLCFWRRQEIQATEFLLRGVPVDVFALPTCLE
jgi:hypothetical protein